MKIALAHDATPVRLAGQIGCKPAPLLPKRGALGAMPICKIYKFCFGESPHCNGAGRISDAPESLIFSV